jgi:hypothetical protein
MTAESFCTMFINSTTPLHSATFSALEQYFANTNSPFTNPVVTPDYSVIGEVVFSQRLAQLVNTYWLAAVAPFSVTGNFTAHDHGNPGSVSVYDVGTGVARNTTAHSETMKRVLVCNTPWLAVLIIGSLVMLAASIATTIINLLRKGLEVLDGFASALRDNPYVRAETGLSMENASDIARRLQRTRVMLGDVRPTEETGYVAVASQGRDDGIHRIQRLRAGRVYR